MARVRNSVAHFVGQEGFEAEADMMSDWEQCSRCGRWLPVETRHDLPLCEVCQWLVRFLRSCIRELERAEWE